MRLSSVALAAAVAATPTLPAPGLAQDADRTVKGGISVDGWQGRVDRRAASRGSSVADSKFAPEGNGFRLSIGPAAVYWNPANVARGNYAVKATFTEHKMEASHPHSYGIFIGGTDLTSDTEKLLYCIVYGNGTYSVKTFHGAKVTTLVDREKHSALKQAGASGESTNEIGWRVDGDNVACVVNGTAVKTFAKSDVIGPEKLTSTDGVYGIRVSHNLELTVTGLGMSR